MRPVFHSCGITRHPDSVPNCRGHNSGLVGSFASLGVTDAKYRSENGPASSSLRVLRLDLFNGSGIMPARTMERSPTTGTESPGRPHPAVWHWLWNETINRLDSYRLRVDTGVDLDAALEFSRFVLWSKLSEVLAPHDRGGPLKVDSSFLRWKAEELQRTVQDAYRDGKIVSKANQAPLEAISRKLDLIAAQVAGLNPEAGLALGVRRPGRRRTGGAP